MSEEIKSYWLRLDDIGGHESMVRASDMDRLVAKRDARIVELESGQSADMFLTLTGEITQLRAELARMMEKYENS